MKYLKYKKGKVKNCLETQSINLKFGLLGIQALQKCKITNKQLESIRRTISNKTKRQAKIWFRIFPDTPITKKPTEVRMGKGKGNIDSWIAKVNKGKILFEISGKDINLIKKTLKIALKKLPIKTNIISKYEELK